MWGPALDSEKMLVAGGAGSDSAILSTDSKPNALKQLSLLSLGSMIGLTWHCRNSSSLLKDPFGLVGQ